MTKLQLIKLNAKICNRIGKLDLKNIQVNICLNLFGNLQMIDITCFGGGTNSFHWIRITDDFHDARKLVEPVLQAIETDNYSSFVSARGVL